MKKDLTKFIPFGIALILVLIHIVDVLRKPDFTNKDGSISSYVVNDSVFYASIGLGIVLVLIILKQKFWSHVFLGLIVLSFFPFIQFSTSTIFFGINSLSIDLISLSFLIAHLGMNPELYASIKNLFKPSEESLNKKEAQKKAEFEKAIQRFEQKFESKNKNELEQIVNQNTYVNEAVEAAKRILTKKENI